MSGELEIQRKNIAKTYKAAILSLQETHLIKTSNTQLREGITVYNTIQFNPPNLGGDHLCQNRGGFYLHAVQGG